MAIKFSDKEWEVFCNMLSGVESGGQIYGNGDWGDFTEAFAATANETGITLGAYQFFGVEAHQLIAMIQSKYPTVFNKYDTAGIAADLKASDWSNYQISKSSAKAKCIVNMISSKEGIECQKLLVRQNSQKLLEYAYSLGVTDHKALAMCVQIAHLGGSGALKRIITKTAKPYTVSTIDAALRTDNQSSTQVGAKLFRSRHDCFIKWIDQYWPKNTSSTTTNTGSSTATTNNTGGKTSMAKTYPAGYLSNCGRDENHSYAGGKAGDQDGGEWALRSYYVYPWTHVLRHPDANVRKTIAGLAVEAALNDNIGYDQYERTTFWYQLAKSGYHPANIKTPCETDCSAGVAAVSKAAGYLLGDAKLKAISEHNYTGSMVSAFRSAGFEILTSSKYLTSSDYLLAGDILLNESHHTCTVISGGAKSGESPASYDGTTVVVNSNSGGSSSSDDSINFNVKSYVYVNKAQAALRSWAGEENSKLVSFPTVVKGQKLGLCDTIKDDNGKDWYFVKIEDKYGFINSDDVSTKEPTAGTSGTTETTTNASGTITINGVKMSVSNGSSFNTSKRKWTGKVTASSLALRQWSGTDSPKLVSLPSVKKGKKLYVYDVLLDDEGAPWLYVKVKNPTTGNYIWAFCYAAYVEKV